MAACVTAVMDYVACLFFRMMMLLMRKLLLIRLHFWLAVVNTKSWIYSIRFDIILSLKIIVLKAACCNTSLIVFSLVSSLLGLLRKDFRFKEEVLGSSITLLWHIPNWKAADRWWVCIFAFYRCLSNVTISFVFKRCDCCVVFGLCAFQIVVCWIWLGSKDCFPVKQHVSFSCFQTLTLLAPFLDTRYGFFHQQVIVWNK